MSPRRNIRYLLVSKIQEEEGTALRTLYHVVILLNIWVTFAHERILYLILASIRYNFLNYSRRV